MIELVLANSGIEPVELESKVTAGRVFSLDGHALMPFDRHQDSLERQATLVVDGGLLAARGDRCVDHRGRGIGLGRKEDEQPSQDPHLRGCETGTAGVAHELGHSINEPAEVVVEVLDGVRPQAKDRIRVLPDLCERQASARVALGVRLVLVVFCGVLVVR